MNPQHPQGRTDMTLNYETNQLTSLLCGLFEMNAPGTHSFQLLVANPTGQPLSDL